MDFESRKKKSWNEFGVSEIVGNILILMITVILFSGIMAFVQQMPVPEQATKVDFSAKATFGTGGTTAALSVTHAGGAVMKAKDTIVIIEKDGVNKRYNMSDPVYGLKGADSWRMGMTWTVTVESTTYTSKITVTVVDLVKKAAVWSSQVTGGAGGNPPNILQRWVDSNNITPTPDPVLEWDNWSLYVTITDPDNDLNTTNGIWIDSSQIETDRPGTTHRLPVPMKDNVYRWDFVNIRARHLNASAIDGRVISIFAWDSAGHRSISTYVMSITILPTNVNWYPTQEPDIPSPDSNLPSYIRWFFDNQGFGIFGEKIVNGSHQGSADTGTIKIEFSKTAGDELVYIRFASKVMSNIFTENKMTLLDIRTGLPFVPTFNGTSTASAPFYPYPGGGGVYLYECQFKIASLPVGAYTISISLKNQPSTGEPQRVYSGDKTIFIIDQYSSISFYPKIYMYKNTSFVKGEEWGARTTPFQLSSVDSFKIYVYVEVQDTDTPPNPGVAEVRISDGAKNSELFGVPPAGNMISKVGSASRVEEDAKTHYYYNFSIDMRMNNGNQWRGGLNSYTLYITKLNDTNEGMYSLSEQVFITGAGLRADFFVGTTGMAAGNSNFNTREYQFYIQNNNFFSSRVMWQSESTPGSSTDFTVSAMGVGDTDGDGDKDLLMGQAASNTLWLFENTLNTFGSWQSGSVIARPPGDAGRITWITFGDVNGDGDDDFAYSNENGRVVIYNTTYGSKGWLFTPAGTTGWTAPISKIELKDMTGDELADLVVLASGKINIYDLKYYYTPALFSYADKDKKGWFAHSTGTTMDFDIDDMNGDGMLDILTADSTAAFAGGSASPNFNKYLKLDGAQVALDPSVIPNSGAGNLSAGNVGNTVSWTDGLYIEFSENGTDRVVDGIVSKTMRFYQLTQNPDQQLRVYARTGAHNGTAQEVFYGWYSIDGLVFIPMMTIDSTSWKFYNFTLPSSVMGQRIYLRFTDSDFTKASGANQDYIQVNMAGVFTDTFGGYVGSRVGPDTDTTWTTIRSASIDGGAGNSFKEVVIAKHHDTIATNSLWKIYKTQDGVSWTSVPNIWATGTVWPGLATSFFVSSAAKVGTGYYNNLASTIFDAVDINGDGFTDILVTNYTTTATKNSYVGYYMNLWTGSETYWRYYAIKSWTIDPPTGQAKDPWVCTTAATSLTVVA